jgi:uncharacterized membrane protein
MGGVLFVLPLAFVMMLIEETVEVLSIVSVPMANLIPVESVGGVAMATIVALVMALLLCFLVGLIIRTRFGNNATEYIDKKFLSKIPGYGSFKSLSRQFAGAEAEDAYIPAVITMGEDTYALGFIIEELDDGYCTVMVPGVPSPTSGMLRYLKKEKVRRLDVPISMVFEAITYWGEGSGALISGR